jgi:hypothetical protein
MKKEIQKTLNDDESNIIKPIISDPKDPYLIFECPVCNLLIQVNKNETNCCIFRHAVYKETYDQVSPHINKITCEELLDNDKVFGCCKPFYFIKASNINESNIIMCDYI